MIDASNKQLPPSPHVDVRALSRLFSNTTNSYKYLFFLALLDSLERTAFKQNAHSVEELVSDMLVLAWYPHVFFKLSFGKIDKIAGELEKVAVVSHTGKFKPWDKVALRSALRDAIDSPKELARFVPYRLIRPYFPEIKTSKDHEVNGLVREMAQSHFTTTRPLYKFGPKDESVEVHPDWLDYLSQNIVIVRAWANWNYLCYMQSANPMVPSLATKLFPVAERESLTEQTNYWSAYLKTNEMRCIYSGVVLKPDDIALDHFIPWSFVVHNEVWNLIPVSTTANSAKSDRLPEPRYADTFIAAHHNALTSAQHRLSEKQYLNYRSKYQHRLQIQTDQMGDAQAFHAAYAELLNSHLLLAELNGFEPNWSYRL